MYYFLRSLFFICLVFCQFAVFGQVELIDENGKKLNVDLYLQKAEEQISLGDNREATRYINAIAAGYWTNKDYHKAIEYYLRSTELNKSINNESGIGAIYNNLGMIYADLQDYNNSLECFNNAIKIRRKLQEKQGRISAHINASVVLNKLERYDESAQNLEEALSLASEMNDADQMKSCYGMLAETYEKSGNSEKMIQNYNLYKTFHEMVEKERSRSVNEKSRAIELKARTLEAQKKIDSLELRLKNRELEEKDKMLNQKDTIYRSLMVRYSKNEMATELINKDLKIKNLTLAKNEETIKQETLYRKGLTIAVIIFCLFIFLLGYFYIQKKKSNIILEKKNIEINRQQIEIIEQKNKIEESFEEISIINANITGSINYAKIIQEAVLSNKDNIRKLFADSFIFFKPKDIVSGDFYWFKEINNKIHIAIGDCTGHGVPGALMSMLSINLINQITSASPLKTNEILDILNVGIVNALNPIYSESTEIRDGMDVVYMIIDKKQKTLEYSGARNPLFYVQNNELNIIKADRRSIGSLDSYSNSQNIAFTSHTIDISIPTQIYAASDGYSDQFNEKNNKKFSSAQFRQLLFKNHGELMKNQEQILEQVLNDWKGTMQQIDDIIVMGINI